MKPHNKATWSAGKALLLVVGLVAAGGMSGAFGDGTTPPPDFSKIGQLFDVKDIKAPDGKPTKKGGTAKARRMCPDDPANCWWQ